jgi:hypothetical protein
MATHSKEFLLGWGAARERAQLTGSVPPYPPGKVKVVETTEEGETFTETEFREMSFSDARAYAAEYDVTGAGWDDLVEGLREAGVIVDEE